MKCICRDCGKEYNNCIDYKTSICNECFKKFNEHQVQPLKDENHKLQQQIIFLENRDVVDKTKVIKFINEFYEVIEDSHKMNDMPKIYKIYVDTLKKFGIGDIDNQMR